MLVSVYIRKEDEDKWRSLENKTEEVHKLLNRAITDLGTDILVENPKADKPKLKTDIAELRKQVDEIKPGKRVSGSVNSELRRRMGIE